MSWGFGIGARKKEHPVSPVGQRGPDFGASDDELVAILHCPRLERRQVGPGIRALSIPGTTASSPLRWAAGNASFAPPCRGGSGWARSSECRNDRCPARADTQSLRRISTTSSVTRRSRRAPPARPSSASLVQRAPVLRRRRVANRGRMTRRRDRSSHRAVRRPTTRPDLTRNACSSGVNSKRIGLSQQTRKTAH